MAVFLVDFENVRSDDLSCVNQLSSGDRVILFYSEKADKISIGLHRRILESKAVFEYRKAEVGLKDALDFQLVTYLGFLVAANAKETYVVVSNDKGFDSAASFWRRQGYDVRTAPCVTVPRRQEPVIPQQTTEPDEPTPSAEPAAEPAVETAAEPQPSAQESAPAEPAAETAAPAEASEGPSVPDETESGPVSEDERPAAPAIPEEPVDSSDPVGDSAAPRAKNSSRRSRGSASRKQTQSKAAAKKAPEEESGASEEELEALRQAVAKVLGESENVPTVAEHILRYKTKQGINNALVKKYGSQAGGELYQKIKPLIAKKK